MARHGASPPTRIFEAAGAGACIITDAWDGIEAFLEPGREVLVAERGEDVVDYINGLTEECARSFGDAVLKHVLAHHTYAHRAAEVDAVLRGYGAMKAAV